MPIRFLVGIADTPLFAEICKHRARPQHRPRVHESGALLCETSDMWIDMQALPFHSYFVSVSTREESAPESAEQAAPPGVVHIDTAAARRSEDAAFGDHSHACQPGCSCPVCHSEGCGCRAALHRPMRLTMMRHHCD